MRKLTPRQVAKIDRYLAAHRAKKDSEAELEAAKGDVLALVASRGGAITHDSARLTLETTVRYDYSDSVKALRAEVARLQAEEKEDGTATQITGEKLVCRDAHE